MAAKIKFFYRLDLLEQKYSVLIEQHRVSKRKLQEAEMALSNMIKLDGIEVSRPLFITNTKEVITPMPSPIQSELDFKNEAIRELKDTTDTSVAKKDETKMPSKEQKIEVFTNPWSILVDNYEPINYTSKSVLTSLNADIDLMS